MVTQEAEKLGLRYPSHQFTPNLYYISELLRAYHDQRSLAREHLNSTLNILKMMDLSQKPTDLEIKKCEVHLPLKNNHNGIDKPT
jgi:hypothetical protein